MRTKLLITSAVLCGLVFAGCDKDEDGIRVDPGIEKAFQTRYPSANRVEWEKKAGYYVAEFWNNNAETEAWFSGDAVWHMTETDVRYDDLPLAVRDGFMASDYADWRIDDIDMLECAGVETVYIIEVEQGNREYDLYFSTEGVLVKAVAEGGGQREPHPSEGLETLKNFIAGKYPNARIMDVDQERDRIEIDIIDGRTSREVVFSLSGEWSYTKTEVRRADVPSVVLNTLAASEYNSWKIDDIDHFETPSGHYYLFELESGNREINLKIGTDGQILY